jgi:hypothetical protein
LGFVVGEDDLLELDFELSVLELLDVAVLVSEPQPDSTTARAVMAAATPVSAEALISFAPCHRDSCRGGRWQTSHWSFRTEA